MLAGAAREVERQLVAVHGRGAAAARRSPSRASSTSRAVYARPRARRGTRACAARRSRAPRRSRRSASRAPSRSCSSARRRRPGAVGGELGAQVGAALGGLAHALGELGDRGVVERRAARSPRPRRRACGSRPASSPASGRRRRRGGRGWRRSRSARRPANSGRDDRDVGQVGAARVGVVEDPRAPGRVLSSSTAATAAGIAPRCTGMCSACITISPRGSNRRGRGVAALLDVGRVRRADQHRAHLLAGRAQRADHDLELDRVESPRVAPGIVPVGLAPRRASRAGPAASPRRARPRPGRRSAVRPPAAPPRTSRSSSWRVEPAATRRRGRSAASSGPRARSPRRACAL